MHITVKRTGSNLLKFIIKVIKKTRTGRGQRSYVDIFVVNIRVPSHCSFSLHIQAVYSVGFGLTHQTHYMSLSLYDNECNM